MRNMEANIVHENGPFYAYKTPKGYEIRKNGATCAVLIGKAPTSGQAIRFIDRAVQYANNF